MKIVLVGAGSAQFGYGTLGDIFCSKVLKGAEVVLHDINAHTLKTVYETAHAFIQKKKLDFKVKAELDRRTAFKGADFIISSIEVGNRFELWDQDWKVPQQFGIHQVYGENGGPGGVFHSLRIIPPILEIVKDAVEICPDAWIFNYSNPMTAICTAVNRAFPKAHFVGMCHEIGWLSRWLPPMLDMKLDDIYFKAAGLNHFSCMLEIKNKKTGKNLYPEVLRKADKFFHYESGYSDVWDMYRKTGKFEETERFYRQQSKGKSAYEWADRRLHKFILETYRLLPITVDSHFGEYIGWAWDLVDHRGILDFYDFYKVELREKPAQIKLETHERVIPIIDGIIKNSGYEESAVNIQNNGLIEELPPWIAVEVPAVIDKNGVNGFPIKKLPKGYAALLRNYCGVYDLTAEAVLKKDKNLVVQALLANPVVNMASVVKPMVDHMINAQRKWLGYLK